MGAEAFDSCPSCRRRRSHRWTWGGLTAVVVGVVVALASGRGPRRVEAQGAKPTGAAAALTYTYKQALANWRQIDDVINNNARDGWEPFQAVPLENAYSPNRSETSVLVLFRRPADRAR